MFCAFLGCDIHFKCISIKMLSALFLNVIGKVHQDCPGPELIKLFFMLNSTEHEIYSAHKCYNANIN